ncbi:DUF3122 domain-containing protein, partial [Microcoleus sp. LAD1_D3]|uniref:DUF3122 domain-containing protein n=1 Tax=Microcoleus sp. LAD1_D3 TaxID=2819365 RepID=UPI002FCED078
VNSWDSIQSSKTFHYIIKLFCKRSITQLESNRPLLLSFPVKNQKETELLVPPFAVREWRLLLDRN